MADIKEVIKEGMSIGKSIDDMLGGILPTKQKYVENEDGSIVREIKVCKQKISMKAVKEADGTYRIAEMSKLDDEHKKKLVKKINNGKKLSGDEQLWADFHDRVALEQALKAMGYDEAIASSHIRYSKEDIIGQQDMGSFFINVKGFQGDKTVLLAEIKQQMIAVYGAEAGVKHFNDFVKLSGLEAELKALEDKEKPVAEKPVEEKPTAEKPVEEKPVVEKSGKPDEVLESEAQKEPKLTKINNNAYKIEFPPVSPDSFPEYTTVYSLAADKMVSDKLVEWYMNENAVSKEDATAWAGKKIEEAKEAFGKEHQNLNVGQENKEPQVVTVGEENKEPQVVAVGEVEKRQEIKRQVTKEEMKKDSQAHPEQPDENSGHVVVSVKDDMREDAKVAKIRDLMHRPGVKMADKEASLQKLVENFGAEAAFELVYKCVVEPANAMKAMGEGFRRSGASMEYFASIDPNDAEKMAKVAELTGVAVEKKPSRKIELDAERFASTPPMGIVPADLKPQDFKVSSLAEMQYDKLLGDKEKLKVGDLLDWGVQVADLSLTAREVMGNKNDRELQMAIMPNGGGLPNRDAEVSREYAVALIEKVQTRQAVERHKKSRGR